MSTEQGEGPIYLTLGSNEIIVSGRVIEINYYEVAEMQSNGITIINAETDEIMTEDEVFDFFLHL